MKFISNKEDMALKIGANKLHQGRKFSYSIIEKNHQKYFDKNKKSYKKIFLEKRNCPTCASSKFFNIFKKRGGTYVKCLNCDMIYLNPVFKDKELSKYYANLHDAQSKITLNESFFYKLIYTKGLDAIERFKNKGKFLMDIGCSSGFFLDIALKYGWKTYGIEFNKEKKLIKKNHTIFSQDIDTLPSTLKFDLVTMWDVFEHIKDGNQFLKKIKSRLNNEGLIFMQTPNVSSLAARILQEKCNVFDGIEHVNLYNFQTIKILAKNNNLKILNIKSVISEIPIISNYLDFTNPYFGQSDFKSTILNLIDEKKLHKNQLGYKMQVILKKL